MRQCITIVVFLLSSSKAFGLGVPDLSHKEAMAGLKEALIVSANKAVGQLAAQDGFFANSEVKIPLPNAFKKAEKGMRMLGMGKDTDALVLNINRAAEAAVPEAKVLLMNAVKQMSVDDAKAILTGKHDAATQYFKRTTSAAMVEKLLPIVKKITENVKLAQQYNQLADMGSKFGIVKNEQVSLEAYVTQKTLDGVYLMMAKEEAAIRQNPLGQASQMIKKVFGAIGK